MCVSDNIEKILFKNGDKSLINNYGVYNYFNFSDYIQDSKMVATLIDDKYIITYGNAEECYHYDLQYVITNKFGKFDFTIIAYANDLLVWKEDKLSDDEIDVIIGITEEIKKYILDTGIPKNIGISSDNINLNCYGNDISNIIEFEDSLINCKNKKNNPTTK